MQQNQLQFFVFISIRIENISSEGDLASMISVGRLCITDDFSNAALVF